ncbi:SUMF1/EgtB/PvdO family nonheme iron enzyme [Myxococcota bacterium]|nr:SUMF1/EgtB/PvdO family nonheme iron enzyme [Myxococcota bacterium]
MASPREPSTPCPPGPGRTPRSGPPPIPASALAPPPSAPTVAQRGRPIRVEGRAPMTGPLAGLEGQETRPPELHPRAPARQSSTIGMKAAPAILRGTDQMAFIDDRVFEDADGERHVTNAFYIDKTPVTNTEYYEYVKKTGMNPPPHWHGPQPPITLLDHPVVGVNFEEAKRFARWRGARLPSSEEWQAAAIGPDNAPFPWGGWLPGYCNSVEMDINTTTPVTAYPQGASQAGCLDLVGNVWEWVEGGGIGLKAEVWGGSFREVCNQKGRISRSQAPKDKRYLFVGFRCAKDAP